MSFAKKFLKKWLNLGDFSQCPQDKPDKHQLQVSANMEGFVFFLLVVIQHYLLHRVTLSTRQIAFLSRTCKKLDSWGPINLSFIFSRNHAGLRWISNSHFAGCVALHPIHLCLKNIIVPHSQTCICNSLKCTFYLEIEHTICVTF